MSACSLPMVISRGNTCSHCWKAAPERMGRTAFPLLKCLTTPYGRHCEPFFGPKCPAGPIAKFCIYKHKKLPEMLPPPERSRCLTQTPISARLASISIVPVLRNDHCSSQYIFRYQFWLIKFLFFFKCGLCVQIPRAPVCTSADYKR